MALHLTDNWQMTKILTGNWHLYPSPSRPSGVANQHWIYFCTCRFSKFFFAYVFPTSRNLASCIMLTKIPLRKQNTWVAKVNLKNNKQLLHVQRAGYTVPAICWKQEGHGLQVYHHRMNDWQKRDGKCSQEFWLWLGVVYQWNWW